MMDINLVTIWEKFRGVTRIEFQAQSEMPNGWNGKGSGSVIVENPGKKILIFNEQGEWKSPDGRKFTFKNRYRWTITSDGLQLEHLRFGIHNPVLLVELQSTGLNKWESLKPHICGDDSYSGILEIRDDVIKLDWSVTGPKKCEKLVNIYS